jgi:hypothetical protein
MNVDDAITEWASRKRPRLLAQQLHEEAAGVQVSELRKTAPNLSPLAKMLLKKWAIGFVLRPRFCSL